MTTLSLSVAVSLGEFDLRVEHEQSLDGITALYGPSGSGKTTLLRVVAGLERRARGRIAFGNEIWQADGRGLLVPAHRRGIGYVFQDARLFPHLSVAGNLAYAERRSRAAGGPIDHDGVVAALDLGPLLRRSPASLSGGERQRVAMGRTLLARPRLLLMDEPLAALDAARKAEILPYIERLSAAFRVPILYVTHIIEEVARLADRMVVLTAGRKVAEGPVAQVLERLDLGPATGRFEAGIVLVARVIGHDQHYRLTSLDHRGQTIVMPRFEAPAGTEVRLRIRARDVVLAIRRPEGLSVRNVLEGQVIEIAEERDTAFAEVLVGLDAGRGTDRAPGSARIRARVTRLAVAELALEPGKPVFALVKSVAFDRRALSVLPSLRGAHAAEE